MLFYPKQLVEAPRYIYDGASPALRPTFLSDFTRQPADTFHRALKFLCIGRLHISPRMAAWLTGRPGWMQIERVGPADTFLADGVTNLRTLQAIAWMLPATTRKINYFNNTLRFVLPGRDLDALTSGMKRIGYELYTFDPDDAERYGLRLSRQFYRQPDTTISAATPTDCFFCGVDKGRAALLGQLRQDIERSGLSTRFIVVSQPAQRITYEQYLSHVKACRCIVDIVQQDQAGITRRPVEALFWRRKLITNNPRLLDVDFYRPENIFVLGHDDIGRLRDFILSPLADIPADVVRRYHVDTWLQTLA